MVAVNEKQKLLSATWLNTIASGVVSAGTCGSFLAYSFGTRPGINGLQVLAISAVSVLTGAAIHFLARAILSTTDREQ